MSQYGLSLIPSRYNRLPRVSPFPPVAASVAPVASPTLRPQDPSPADADDVTGGETSRVVVEDVSQPVFFWVVDFFNSRRFGRQPTWNSSCPP